MAWKDRICGFVVVGLLLPVAMMQAQQNPFKDAPASAKAMKNPVAGQQSAIDAGKTLYARNCLSCHGKTLQGTGNVPSLADGKLKGVTAGEIFWFVTKGSPDNGMPAWGFMPEDKRWQIVSYVEAVVSGKTTASAASAPAPESGKGKITTAAPKPPFHRLPL